MSASPDPYWLRIARHGLRYARGVVIAVIGGTVLLLGIAMIFTPGPGLLVILAGLGILATEFVWARRLLQHTKDYIASKRRKTEPAATTASVPAAQDSAQTGRSVPVAESDR